MSNKILILGFGLIAAHLFVSKQGKALWDAVTATTAKPAPSVGGTVTPQAQTAGTQAAGSFLQGQPGVAGVIGSVMGLPPLIGGQDPRIANPGSGPGLRLPAKPQSVRPAWWPSWIPYFGN